MDASITTAWITRPVQDTEPTPPGVVEPPARRSFVDTATVTLGLLLLVVGSASGWISDGVLGVVALVLLPHSARILITGRLPRWVGGLGLALTVTALLQALDAWSL